MLHRLILASFLISSLSYTQNTSSEAKDQNSGIVYGNDHAFFLTAPKGWILDDSSGVSQGLYAVFYPRGGSWETSPAVMYANTARKSTEGNETRDKLISYDISRYKENHPEVKITNSPELQTKDKKIALVKLFSYSNYESVAYIDEQTITVLIVLTARTKKDFLEAFPAFQELVRSYSFITTEVHIDK